MSWLRREHYDRGRIAGRYLDLLKETAAAGHRRHARVSPETEQSVPG
jgi:hypothetical protein